MAIGGFGLLAAFAYAGLAPRFGKLRLRALIEIVVWGATAFGLVYGCMWYFTVYLAAQPDALIFFKPALTATP